MLKFKVITDRGALSVSGLNVNEARDKVQAENLGVTIYSYEELPAEEPVPAVTVSKSEERRLAALKKA